MGWTYNTANNAPNSGIQITVTAVALTSASLSFLLLRFYVRGILIKAIGADDWTLIPTWIASCGFAVVTIVQTKWGLGLQQLEDMPLQNIYNFGLVGTRSTLFLSDSRLMKPGSIYGGTILH